MSRDGRTSSSMTVRLNSSIQPPLRCAVVEQVSFDPSLMDLEMLAHFDYRLSSSVLSGVSSQGTLSSFAVLTYHRTPNLKVVDRGSRLFTIAHFPPIPPGRYHLTNVFIGQLIPDDAWTTYRTLARRKSLYGAACCWPKNGCERSLLYLVH